MKREAEAEEGREGRKRGSRCDVTEREKDGEREGWRERRMEGEKDGGRGTCNFASFRLMIIHLFFVCFLSSFSFSLHLI